MAEDFFYMQDVSGLVVFHCGFPVSERVQAYLFESWVLEFECYAFACFVEVGF